jgi:hypothetical protein
MGYFLKNIFNIFAIFRISYKFFARSYPLDEIFWSILPSPTRMPIRRGLEFENNP